MKHAHKYTLGKSGTVETCTCGAFRHANLNPDDVIVEIPARETKQQTAVYLPGSLVERLGRFMLEKRAGKLHVRNQIIIDALTDYLTRHGY